MNMLRVFAALRNRMPPVVPKLYAMQPRLAGGWVMISDSCVIKECRPAAEPVYACLGLGPGASQIPCAISVTAKRDAGGGMVRLSITPVCFEARPTSGPELQGAIRDVLTALSALHVRGVVHRDVRWPNVLRAPDGKAWLLSDFEHAMESTAETDRAADVKMVGSLIDELPATMLPEGAAALAARLRADTPPTADQALNDTWLVSS